MEITINGEQYLGLEEVAALCGFTEKTLKQYIKIKKVPKLNQEIIKIGSRKFVSKSGLECLMRFKKSKMNHYRGKEITLGGETFRNKKEAANFFGFHPEDLSRYLRVKNTVAKYNRGKILKKERNSL